MSYRKLLVGLADIETAPRVMLAAASLAATHGARIVGVHVVPAGTTQQSGLPLAVLGDRLRDIFEDARHARAFSGHWQVIEDSELSAGGALVELGNTCDALILGQRHAREAGRSGWHLGEHVVGATARPVLLVPDGGEREFTTERVLVAWNGNAESTRAVFDALPLLQLATHVRIHRFNPPPSERAHDAGMAEDLAATLARHGVAVELSQSTVSVFEIGEEILALARDIDADLLVSGCRIHSRLRESLFGSTTRHLFEQSNRPLLMGG